MTEWIVVNGHVLGQCAYLNADDLDEPCDCRDLLDSEDGEFWDEDEELRS